MKYYNEFVYLFYNKQHYELNHSNMSYFHIINKFGTLRTIIIEAIGTSTVVLYMKIIENICNLVVK